MGGSGITLFHVRGIRIAVDWSWLIVLFLIILGLTGFYRDVLNEPNSSSMPYVLAVISAFGFFASILLHELGHAFVATRRGIGITSIQLWLFGGVARMDRDADSPTTEFRVAIAGPLVTLAIAVALTLVGLLAGGSDFWDAMRFRTGATISGALAAIAWLASANALILGFNLLPAFPMDGGRVARAIAWWRTGNRNSATRFAATLGRGFAYLFIAIGILLIFTGADPFGGVWLAFIGILINGSARAAMLQSAVSSRIEGMRVSDVMDTDPVAIPDQISVEEALDEYFLRYRWPWFPVVDAAQRFKGLLVRESADQVPEVSRASSRVSELMEPDPGSLHISLDAPLEALLGNEALRRLGAVMAVDADGRLRGVITAEQIGRALRGESS
jgi:Zn-dependent protease